MYEFLFNPFLVSQALSRQVTKGSGMLISLANSLLQKHSAPSQNKSVKNDNKLQNQESEDVLYRQQG